MFFPSVSTKPSENRTKGGVFVVLFKFILFSFCDLHGGCIRVRGRRYFVYGYRLRLALFKWNCFNSANVQYILYLSTHIIEV